THKVRQAVQQRMAEATIRDHERREADIINFLPDATFAIDTRGVVIAWNRAMETMTGVPSSEILGRGNYAYAIPFYHGRRPILIDLVLSNDPGTEARYPYIKRDGKTLFSEITIPHFNHGRGAALWFTASPLYDTGGNIVGAIESIREITEWKRAEEALNESEKRFRELADMLPQAVFEADINGILKYANRFAFEIFGHSEDAFRKGLNVLQMIAPPDRERATAAYRAMVGGKGKKRGADEYYALKKDGQSFPISIYSSPIVVNGRITGIRGIIVDITERKRAENDLQNSVAFLNSLIDQSPTPMWISDEIGTLIRINKACCDLLNVSEAEVMGKYSIFDDNIVKEQDFMPLVHDVFHKGVVAQFQLIYDTNQLKTLELDKHVSLFLDVTIFPVRDNRGKITNAVIQHTDITDRRRSEERVSESEQNYRLLFENATEGILIAQGDRMVHVNSALIRLLGRPAEVITSRPFTDFIHPDDREMVMGRHLQRMRGEVPPTGYMFRIITGEGQEKWVWINSTKMTWSGKPASFSFLTDMTERKLAEDRLVAAGNEYENLLDQIQDIYYRSDTEGRLIRASRSWATLLGYDDVAECIGRSIADDFYFNPADRQRFLEEINREGKVTNYEVLLMKKDGTPVLVSTSSHVIVDATGKVIGVEGTFRDITERKRIEEALSESEQRYRNIVEDQTEFICRFLPDGTHIFVNDAYCRYFGLKRDEILGHRFRPEFPPEDRERMKRFFKTLTPGHPVDIIDHRIIMPGGSIRWQRWSDRAIFDPSGKLTEYQSVGRDITEIKGAEEALRRSEGQYRILAGLLDLIPASVTVHDSDGRFLYANEKTFEYHGYTPGEFYGINLHELDIPESEHLIEERIRQLKEAGELSFEAGHFRKDGTVLPLLITAKTAEWDGQPVILSIATDITEHKKTETALQQSEEKYRTLLMSVNEGIWVIDPEGCTTYANQKMAEMLGYTVDEMCGSPMYRFMDEKGREIAAKNYPAYRKGVREKVEFEFVKKDGTLITTIVSNTSLFDSSGTFSGAMAVITDITERKRAEQVIREANKKIGLLTSVTRHDVTNQVSALRGFASIAMMMKPNPGVAEILAKIDSTASAIAQQIEFTRAYQELSMHTPDWHKISEIVAQQEADGISLSCTCDAEIFADPMLERVFFNLVENAIRHGETVTAMTVSCRPGPDDSLVITVRDNGCGVPPDSKEKIFEKGFGKHTGFGLFLAREVLAITGITIRETGTFGKGAQFEIMVPKGTYRCNS
ncbi:MAG: PAS domain S-box protein, partial [Methanoregula sp.]|nr:PAS domain S-box protein [Methanoregula sp.]